MAEIKSHKGDSFKWFLAVLLLLAGIVADYHYGAVALAVRSAIGIVWLIIILLLVAWTKHGAKAWGFLKSARMELRKVVWPNRRETVQMTTMVIVMVVVTAIILWGIDALFLWAVRWLTGQGG